MGCVISCCIKREKINEDDERRFSNLKEPLSVIWEEDEEVYFN